MNKYTAAEFWGGETERENADKKNGDFCCTLRVFGNALSMRVWRGRKKGRTYFKIPRTFFKFSQTYFFFAPTCPFAHPATKTQKRVKIAGRFSRFRKWIFTVVFHALRLPFYAIAANSAHNRALTQRYRPYLYRIIALTQKCSGRFIALPTFATGLHSFAP